MDFWGGCTHSASASASAVLLSSTWGIYCYRLVSRSVARDSTRLESCQVGVNAMHFPFWVSVTDGTMQRDPRTQTPCCAVLCLPTWTRDSPLPQMPSFLSLQIPTRHQLPPSFLAEAEETSEADGPSFSV